jgi:hypothetical protein
MSTGGQTNPNSFTQDSDGHFTFTFLGLTRGTQYAFQVSFDNFTTVADSVTFTA